MGFRYYFVKIPIEEASKVKGMTLEQLCNYAKATCPEIYDKLHNKDSVDEFMADLFFNKKFLHREYLYELGNLYFDDLADEIISEDRKLFDDKDIQDQYCDFEYYIVGKEGLLKTIESYKKKVINYYEDLLKDDNSDKVFRPRTSEQKIEEHFDNMIREFNYIDFVNLNINDKNILTNSWLYEHAIFNLVHILKTVNWEKYTLLLVGH